MNKKSQKMAPENITAPEEPESSEQETQSIAEMSSDVQSTKPFINQEEDEYTLEVIEDWDGKVDVFHLSQKDPKYEYRFIKADFQNMSLKTGNLLLHHGGWQIVPRKALEKMGLKDKIYPDGTYRVGDTVLARIPKELYDKKKKYKQDMAREPMDRVNRMLKKGDDSVAGVGHPDMKGLQTEKSLRMK